LGDRSVGWVEPVDAFDEFVRKGVFVVAGAGHVKSMMGGTVSGMDGREHDGTLAAVGGAIAS
jgi:hypothetical protein